MCDPCSLAVKASVTSARGHARRESTVSEVNRPLSVHDSVFSRFRKELGSADLNSRGHERKIDSCHLQHGCYEALALLSGQEESLKRT